MFVNASIYNSSGTNLHCIRFYHESLEPMIVKTMFLEYILNFYFLCEVEFDFGVRNTRVIHYI